MISFENIETIKEIRQQPIIFKKIYETFVNNINHYKEFAQKYKNYKILLVGAGTSEFIGNAIQPYWYSKGLNIISVSSTELILNPKYYVRKNEKVVLVSFARSGNSPESVASLDVMNKYMKSYFNLIITCNKNGELAKQVNFLENIELILLPDESNDKGFAMTSSYSGMMMAANLIFSLMTDSLFFENFEDNLSKYSDAVHHIQENIHMLEELSFKRIIYLGSGVMKGIAQESSLKFLELTQGIIPTFFNDILGFRHGPKSILNKESAVLVLRSSNSHSRKYEQDLIEELKNENRIKLILELDYKGINKNQNLKLFINTNLNDEIWIGVYYIYFAQLFAIMKSLSLNIDPDNPCPSGEVNRVVKGVRIHEYN